MSTILFLFIITAAGAQKRTFVRVYDEVGKKIYRGFLHGLSDSSLTITDASKSRVEIPVTSVTTLRLRRSFGHTVLITSLIAGGTLAIMGAASADPDAWIFAYSAGEGAMMGLLTGVAMGAAAGSIVSGTRNRPVFKIDRNEENWKKVKVVLDRYLPPSTELIALNPVTK